MGTSIAEDMQNDIILYNTCTPEWDPPLIQKYSQVLLSEDEALFVCIEMKPSKVLFGALSKEPSELK